MSLANKKMWCVDQNKCMRSIPYSHCACHTIAPSVHNTCSDPTEQPFSASYNSLLFIITRQTFYANID